MKIEIVPVTISIFALCLGCNRSPSQPTAIEIQTAIQPTVNVASDGRMRVVAVRPLNVDTNQPGKRVKVSFEYDVEFTKPCYYHAFEGHAWTWPIDLPGIERSAGTTLATVGERHTFRSTADFVWWRQDTKSKERWLQTGSFGGIIKCFGP
jgi:hypothetical protein